MRVDDRAATTAAAADDFGHLIHRIPREVVRPTTADDVATAVRRAAARGVTVAARGCGHSVYGRAQAADGIVLDMRGLREVRQVRHDRVVVDAGASWDELLAATLPCGLAPPVLPDYLGLSVGGTLTVGGVGATTSRFGLASDNVLELEVVTGIGTRLTCSADVEPDLFDAVRAGLGQAAVITRATLPLVRCPRQVRRFLLRYPDLRSMLHDQRRLAAEGRFDTVQGAVLAAPTGGWTFRLDAVAVVAGSATEDEELLTGLSDDRAAMQASTHPYQDHLSRLAPLERALRANGQWFHPHPWLTTFVGDSGVQGVVEAELAVLTPADLGPFGQIVLSPFHRRPVTSPLVPLPADDLCFAFNLLRIPAAAPPGESARLVAANRSAYDRVRAAGGTLYPVSAVPMSPDDWRDHFGPAFPPLRDTARRHDPTRLLTPGYDVVGPA